MATIHPVMCALIPKSGGTIHYQGQLYMLYIHVYLAYTSTRGNYINKCRMPTTCTRPNYTYTYIMLTPVPEVTKHTLPEVNIHKLPEQLQLCIHMSHALTSIRGNYTYTCTMPTPASEYQTKLYIHVHMPTPYRTQLYMLVTMHTHATIHTLLEVTIPTNQQSNYTHMCTKPTSKPEVTIHTCAPYLHQYQR
ncbi:hypothetical protein DPMN_117057 [Dreissena polymorpha]|uniref:Uncharacterized protein n=1 Tax=Dreissena polymorpha TaxID=45954 RepID=A0A9D4KQJ7_DREPO|nr:hypothetical protein DPMN_117057 [Dreissena polymorpha]